MSGKWGRRWPFVFNTYERQLSYAAKLVDEYTRLKPRPPRRPVRCSVEPWVPDDRDLVAVLDEPLYGDPLGYGLPDPVILPSRRYGLIRPCCKACGGEFWLRRLGGAIPTTCPACHDDYWRECEKERSRIRWSIKQERAALRRFALRAKLRRSRA